MSVRTDYEITTREQLRQLYLEPNKFVIDKERPRLDAATQAFIRACPFVMLATTGADGSVDVSPRGGPSGFVQVLDEHRIALCDVPGNNRLDSMENIVQTGQVGLLFLMPTRGETVRLNGQAVITTDPDILAGFTSELKTPKSAIVITVDTTFIHCAKAIRRSGVWKPDTWDAYNETPDGSDIIACQNDNAFTADAVRSSLEQDYTRSTAAERSDGESR